MKKYLFLLAVILYYENLKAQSYHPLVDSEAVWNQESGGCFGFPFICHSEGEKFSLAGDTAIDGNVYRIVMLQELYQYSANWQSPPPIFISGQYFNLPAREAGLLREDSSRRVWFRQLNGTDIGGCGAPVALRDSDHLLYDFTLKIGDTISYSNTNKLQLSSVDSVQLLNGTWRKRFFFTGIFLGFSQQWIERIGSENGLFGPFKNVIDCGQYLTCYRKASELLYENESLFSTTCDSIIISGIPDRSASQFQFDAWPNSMNNSIEIKFFSQKYSSAAIKIIDLLGRILDEEKVQSNRPLQISASKFEGHPLFFCVLTENNKSIAERKILFLK